MEVCKSYFCLVLRMARKGLEGRNVSGESSRINVTEHVWIMVCNTWCTDCSWQRLGVWDRFVWTSSGNIKNIKSSKDLNKLESVSHLPLAFNDNWIIIGSFSQRGNALFWPKSSFTCPTNVISNV